MSVFYIQHSTKKILGAYVQLIMGLGEEENGNEWNSLKSFG